MLMLLTPHWSFIMNTTAKKTKTTSDNQVRELSVKEVDQVAGGIAWFPIIMAVARFGLSRASH